VARVDRAGSYGRCVVKPALIAGSV